MSERIYWIGTEDQQHVERKKACKARRKQYGQASCLEKDGSCEECAFDMAVALRVSKATFDRAVENGEIVSL